MLDKEEIRSRITEEILATTTLVEKYTELAKPIAPENAIGRISRMDAINNKAVTEAALKKANEKLNNLQVALTKVDDADFGMCIRCKKPIPTGRILLMPQAISCVNCAH